MMTDQEDVIRTALLTDARSAWPTSIAVFNLVDDFPNSALFVHGTFGVTNTSANT